jgi:hypothetical protein
MKVVLAAIVGIYAIEGTIFGYLCKDAVFYPLGLHVYPMPSDEAVQCKDNLLGYAIGATTIYIIVGMYLSGVIWLGSWIFGRFRIRIPGRSVLITGNIVYWLCIALAIGACQDGRGNRCTLQ